MNIDVKLSPNHYRYSLYGAAWASATHWDRRNERAILKPGISETMSLPWFYIPWLRVQRPRFIDYRLTGSFSISAVQYCAPAPEVHFCSIVYISSASADDSLKTRNKLLKPLTLPHRTVKIVEFFHNRFIAVWIKTYNTYIEQWTKRNKLTICYKSSQLHGSFRYLISSRKIGIPDRLTGLLLLYHLQVVSTFLVLNFQHLKIETTYQFWIVPKRLKLISLKSWDLKFRSQKLDNRFGPSAPSWCIMPGARG